MMVISSVVSVSTPPEHREAMLRSLRSTMGPTEVRVGCTGCHLYQDVQQEGRLVLITRWHTWENLHRYLRSDQFRTVLSVVDMSSETPEFQFDTIEKTAGIEFLEGIL